ncbi:hypothetical protein [Secundilactobacillus pentosiphilus]|uniref:hypothetical protein n=1 Tax=Secundilactobacillus pentosiphilus TaxID=1714682 RepID=UPI000B5C3450|nr:hypothetical protein [Secundilactobacillus pentosiphilus]
MKQNKESLKTDEHFSIRSIQKKDSKKWRKDLIALWFMLYVLGPYALVQILEGILRITNGGRPFSLLNFGEIKGLMSVFSGVTIVYCLIIVSLRRSSLITDTDFKICMLIVGLMILSIPVLSGYFVIGIWSLRISEFSFFCLLIQLVKVGIYAVINNVENSSDRFMIVVTVLGAVIAAIALF